ncbi:MAG: putative toxin-antitoxin system toxin component, PIN family [Coriobacteriaceae bacterium]|nr:putative toxin-antitoxin system toxin component, PIN family [Coriobacteriaceae bacterium]
MDRIVIDTNVFVSSLRSARGASFALMRLIDQGRFIVSVSTALLLEYEDAATRSLADTVFSADDLTEIIDGLFAICERHETYFHWRPYLKDPEDEHVLELAVASNSRYIISYNKRDFAGSEQFGIPVLTPQEFLRELGEIR